MYYQSIQGDSFQLLKCSSTAAKQQRAKLGAYPSVFKDEAEAIIAQEKADYCINVYAADILFEDDTKGDWWRQARNKTKWL